MKGGDTDCGGSVGVGNVGHAGANRRHDGGPYSIAITGICGEKEPEGLLEGRLRAEVSELVALCVFITVGLWGSCDLVERPRLGRVHVLTEIAIGERDDAAGDKHSVFSGAVASGGLEQSSASSLMW